MDTVAPTQLSYNAFLPAIVTSANNDSINFEFAGGENDSEWTYTISSDGGGPEITGSGIFGETGIETQ